jgi:hypothetical protein
MVGPLGIYELYKVHFEDDDVERDSAQHMKFVRLLSESCLTCIEGLQYKK